MVDSKRKTKQMLFGLSSAKAFAFQLLGKGKDYDQFLGYWLNNYSIGNDFYELPPIEMISQETGIPYPKLKNLIYDAYNDLVQSKENEIECKYSLKEYCFIIITNKSTYTQNINEIPHIPRVGDSVKINYLKAHLGTDLFKVKGIYHDFVNDKQCVKIYLTN